MNESVQSVPGSGGKLPEAGAVLAVWTGRGLTSYEFYAGHKHLTLLSQ